MKTTINLLLALTILCSTSNLLSAQQTEKELKKELSQKVDKNTRRDTKRLKKEGWYAAPGALMIEKQYERSQLIQIEKNEKNEPKYITAFGNSIAQTQSAGKMQAMETAKMEIAGRISSNILGLVENSISNQQLDNSDAASITKTIAASKNLIAQQLGQVILLSEFYRDKGKNVEVQITLAYNMQTATEIGKRVILKSLEEETKIAHEKLEKLMKF